jgi:hypothetical protein
MNPERKVQSRRREEPCTVINEALVWFCVGSNYLIRVAIQKQVICDSTDHWWHRIRMHSYNFTTSPRNADIPGASPLRRGRIRWLRNVRSGYHPWHPASSSTHADDASPMPSAVSLVLLQQPRIHNLAHRFPHIKLHNCLWNISTHSPNLITQSWKLRHIKPILLRYLCHADAPK